MPSFARKLKESGKRALHALFVSGQRFGVNILPKHFYSQIPDIAGLRRTSAWRAPMSMAGVAGTDIATQMETLRQWIGPVQGKLEMEDVHASAVEANGSDGGYGEIEAQVLYAFVATQRPRKIVQIGCGVSTAVILEASRDVGYEPTVVCIEPYPTEFLTRKSASGEIKLIAEPAQDAQLSIFLQLESGDLLFVDSTHTVMPGSEVNRIVLEVLPRLTTGVYVHFHDIYFPYDYPRRLLSEDLFFHSESALVHAFLACNARYEIRICLSMLHYAEQENLKRLLSRYTPQCNSDGLAAPGGKHFPSALWMRCSA